MKSDPTKWIMSIGFSAVLALMLSVTYLSLNQMDENMAQMSSLIEKTYARTSATHQMRELISLRGEILEAMYLTDDFFERDLMLLELSELALQYKSTRDLLKQQHPSSKELRILKQLAPVINQAQLVNDNAADSLLSGVDEHIIRSNIIEAQAHRREIISRLSSLIVVQDKLAVNTLNDSMQYHENSKDVIIYLTLTTFFVGILISLMVIRQSSSRNVKIQYQASHDDLTNLPNRKEFENQLRHVYWDAKENNTEHALCYMDLDQFKIINDTCGHDAGDQLLINLTKIIKEKIRNHDVLGRLGGDEFGLILKNCSVEKAMEIAEGLVTIVKKYEFLSGERVFHVGVSIGMVSINSKTKSHSSAMSNADVACYAAKDMGRDRVHVHELDGNKVSNLHQELHWVANIQKSIQDNRFSLFTQEITPVAANTAIVMHEVLLRLKDDDGNMLSPGEYIPAAERFGLMKDVDFWVIETALRYSQKINADKTTPHVKLFINLSGNSLVEIKTCAFIIDLLDELNLADNSICFEITETAAIKNITQAQKFISTLRSKSIQFALDDFGSGMSSFGYLKNLEVDYLKIDGSFVLNMANNKLDRAMVASMKEIGNIMNIETIAEHVEDEATLNRLRELNISYAQGYYFSIPSPIENLLNR